ncbi:hypothetical protein ABPG74_011337 [Tetrahymena malaccensis]
MISKIAKSASNIFLRSKAVAQTFNGARALSAFNFSSLEKINKAQSRLVKAVEKELKYEEENYDASDPSLKEFLDENKLVLKEDENSIFIELHKDAGENKVQILFQSRSPQTDDYQGEEEGQEQEQQQQQEGEEGQQNMQDYCDFIVYIVKPNGKAIAYDCSSFDSEIQVNGITLVDDVESHKQSNRYDRLANTYNGPDFHNLDERLQTALVEYLKSVGVNEDVAAFIEHYSLDKEQRLYMRWLKNVHTFLQ